MLQSAMQAVETQQLLNRTFYQGQLYGQSVVLVQGGIGKVRATTTATALACQFPLDGIIFTGVAAGLRSGLQMGDVILAHRAIEHDFGMGRDSGFSLGLDFLPEEESRILEADPQLFAMAKQAQARAFLTSVTPSPPQIRSGLVASGDTFVAGVEVRQRIHALTQADVVEMEGAAVIRVALDAGLPCLLVRSVSDEGDSTDFLQFLDRVAYNSAEIVRVVLEGMGG